MEVDVIESDDSLLECHRSAGEGECGANVRGIDRTAALNRHNRPGSLEPLVVGVAPGLFARQFAGDEEHAEQQGG
jgi:hypothetical protein